MSTGLLEQIGNYNNTEYVYQLGGHGNTPVPGDGRKGIDCSGLVKRLLDDAGYTIPYRATFQMKDDHTHYDFISLADAEPGDIALWVTQGHTGVVKSFVISDGVKIGGEFFGSQNSTGPKAAFFGAGANYWPMPTKYLRPKPAFRTGASETPEPQAPETHAKPGVMAFQYPIRAAGGHQFKNAEDIYKILEGESSGHYLIGQNHFWHGGIHFSEKGAPQCRSVEPVRCIADGVVVAYRLNQDYLQSNFEDNGTCLPLSYSNGFCLIRHDYKSPANATTGKQNSLTFYSLYMHLLPSGRYVEPLDLDSKPKVKIVVAGYRAHSLLPSDTGDEIYGLIPSGVELEIVEEQVCDDLTYAKAKILKGRVPKCKVGDEIWFGYKKNGEPIKNSAGKTVWQTILPPERTRPGYWQGKVTATVTSPTGLPVHSAPQPVAQNAVAGTQQADMVLCTSSKVTFDSGKIFNLQLGNKFVRMAECSLVPGSGGLKGDGVLPSTFWACVEDIGPGKKVAWSPIEPTVFDTVIAVDTAIKAGNPVGYMGLHENLSGLHGGKNSKYQVHLEVFSADSAIEAFLKNEAGLTAGKQYLYLASGAALSPKTPATAGVALTSDHAVDLANATVSKDSTGVAWYEVSVKENGETKTGLVKTEGAVLITQYDWEKLGFTVVKESDANADGFLDPENMPAFFQSLYKEIDSDHDGSVTPQELAAALRDPGLRGTWSKLVGYYPTEWQALSSDPKWARLKELLKDSPAVLKHEQERIDKLVFWDDLSIGLSNQVYHFHPIEFLSNVSSFSPDNDLKWLKVPYGQLTFDVEGNDLEDPDAPLHKYFSRKVHWPAGASGITIGRGYDLGQRPDPETDLVGVGITEPLLSWLLGAKGLSGTAAKEYLEHASEEIKTTFISRKQQYDLFVPIYEFMKNRVIKISAQPFNVANYGALNWEATNPKIQDMVVDLIYRGDYTPSSRERIQGFITSNDLAGLTGDIGDSTKWPNVPQERFNQRVDYLR